MFGSHALKHSASAPPNGLLLLLILIRKCDISTLVTNLYFLTGLLCEEIKLTGVNIRIRFAIVRSEDVITDVLIL